MKSFSRRDFLATTAVTGAAALVLRPNHAAAQPAAHALRAARRHLSASYTRLDASTLKTLADAAIDAAKRAGATYTDVRFRVAQHEDWGVFQNTRPSLPSQYHIIGVGVRALTNGYWGFAAHDEIPSSDVMAQLGRAAAAQAAVNAKGPSRTVELAATPVVSDGHWTMPIEIDPFTVSYDEKIDFMTNVGDYVMSQAFGLGTFSMITFVKEDRTFVSSEGTFCSQTVYTSGGFLQIGTDPDWETERPGGRTLDCFTNAGAGWEYFLRMPYQDRLMRAVDDAMRSRRPKPVDVGRYDVVFDAAAMANILDHTIAPATELDRAMGYQSADVGSSFLDDPLTMLGSYHMGSPLVTVTATRSMPGGAATVKWDDEGVEPVDVALVSKGILTDYQTTRESASWLAPYYQRAGRPVRSSGGSGAAEAVAVPRTWPSNFVLAPDPTHDRSLDDLVSSVKHGYVVKGGYAYSDFQCLNGNAAGDVVFEITNGKIGNAIQSADISFRAPEFWKNVSALGGAGSAESFGMQWGRDGFSRREFSSQSRIGYTMRTVPTLVTQVPLTDAGRRS